MNWTSEELQIIESASSYESLLQHPAYHRLLNLIGHHASEELAALESAPYADPRIRLARLDAYTRWNKILYTIQREIQETIAERDQLISQVLRQKGYSLHQVEDILKNKLFQGNFDATNTADRDPSASPDSQSDGWADYTIPSDFDASKL